MGEGGLGEKSVLASLVNIVDCAVNILERERLLVVGFAHGAAAFGHKHELVPWDFVLFDRLADDLL